MSYRIVSDLAICQLKVYDVLGNEVATLVNEEKPTGEYEIQFNAANLPSGFYFYQLKAGEFVRNQEDGSVEVDIVILNLSEDDEVLEVQSRQLSQSSDS